MVSHDLYLGGCLRFAGAPAALAPETAAEMGVHGAGFGLVALHAENGINPTHSLPFQPLPIPARASRLASQGSRKRHDVAGRGLVGKVDARHVLAARHALACSSSGSSSGWALVVAG